MVDLDGLRAEAVALIGRHCPLQPQMALILGSGLGGLAERIEQPHCLSFAEIPGFASSTASGHRGQLILGYLADRPIVAMAGRLHRYEGWTNQQIGFPVAVMAALGASGLIVSNAAGGVNPKLRVGDIVVIRDHLDWLWWRTTGGGVHNGTAAWSPCKANASADATRPFGYSCHRGEVYDRQWSRIALQAALAGRFNALPGTYLATLGPNYETRSEYRMMRRLGVDVVGMSTVPEVSVATELRLRVLGLSMVSNVANPDRPQVANHAEVLEAGRAAEVKMETIVRTVLQST